MTKEVKIAIFFLAFAIVVPLGIWMYARSPRFRPAVLMTLILGTMYPGSAVTAINLISLEWYRGTTRGLEICYLDWLSLILLFGQRLRKDRPQKFFIPAGFGPMVVYIVYVLFTLLTQNPMIFGTFEFAKILRGLICYVAVANVIEGPKQARTVVTALSIAMLWQGYLGVTQRYLGGRNRVPGSFDHANSLSIYCILGGVILFAIFMSNEKLKVRLPAVMGGALAAVAVILTQSRTGFVCVVGLSALCFIACGILKPTVRNVAILVAVLAVGGGIIAKSWKTISGRMAENANEVTDDPTEGRGYYFNLAKLIVKDHPMGCGLNNWSYYVTNIYGGKLGMEYNPYKSLTAAPDQEVPYGSKDLAQAAPGHSLMALTVGELGYPGLFLFAIVWLRWFSITGMFLFKRKEDICSRLGLGIFFALLGAFNQSQTEWEFRQTAPFFMVHILMGTAAALLKLRQEETSKAKKAVVAPKAPVPAALPAAPSSPAS